MELLLSNFPPGKFNDIKNPKDVFASRLQDSDLVKIATGYISSESLIELKKIVELNNRPRINLLIGMHKFDGFSEIQYAAALALNEYLVATGMGFVNLSNTVKYHGKIYSFSKNGTPFGSIIGSSNLSSILTVGERNRIYETDFYFDESKHTKKIDTVVSELIHNLGSRIDKISKESLIFKEFNSLLENQENVEKIDDSQNTKFWSTISNLRFEIPIKTEPRSSLNIFFGKGRISPKQFEIPRPWYEAELIVSKLITQQKDYPSNKTFTVITDDGWKFDCKTSGDFSKNFRSKDDLQILGRWLKGRLENKGSLNVGEPVTEDVLKKYGNAFMSLISTTDPNIWLLEFKPK